MDVGSSGRRGNNGARLRGSGHQEAMERLRAALREAQYSLEDCYEDHLRDWYEDYVEDGALPGLARGACCALLALLAAAAAARLARQWRWPARKRRLEARLAEARLQLVMRRQAAVEVSAALQQETECLERQQEAQVVADSAGDAPQHPTATLPSKNPCAVASSSRQRPRD